MTHQRENIIDLSLKLTETFIDNSLSQVQVIIFIEMQRSTLQSKLILQWLVL